MYTGTCSHYLWLNDVTHEWNPFHLIRTGKGNTVGISGKWDPKTVHLHLPLNLHGCRQRERNRDLWDFNFNVQLYILCIQQTAVNWLSSKTEQLCNSDRCLCRFCSPLCVCLKLAAYLASLCSMLTTDKDERIKRAMLQEREREREWVSESSGVFTSRPAELKHGSLSHHCLNFHF